MSLELARFLVERGLVDAGRMDDLLQRQVLFGGSLDTNALEAGLLDEGPLASALAEFHHLPLAGPELLAQRDPRMPKLFPARLAQKYQVVPVVMSGRSLLVLAAGRIDPLWVDEINFMLSLSVRTHLVTEARLQALMRDWLGLEIEPRFAALADRLGPFGAAPEAAHEPEPGLQEGSSPERLAAQEALAAVAPAPPLARPEPPPRPGLDDESRVRVAQALGTLAARDAVERVRRELQRSGQLSLAEATQACLEAQSRDAIVDVLLRYSRQFMEFVGLFVVQDGALFGWDAVGSLDARERIHRVRLPAGTPSVLRTVLQSQASYLGPVPASGNNQELLQSLGRSRPLNAFIAPIVVHSRIVAVLYGDAGVRSIRGQRVGDLLVFLSRLSGAFERLILRRKGLKPGTVPTPRASRVNLPLVEALPAEAVASPAEAPFEVVELPPRVPAGQEAASVEPVAVESVSGGPETSSPGPEERWRAAASRTLDLPVVEEPPLEVDGQASWDGDRSGVASEAAARSTQEGLAYQAGDDAPLELAGGQQPVERASGAPEPPVVSSVQVGEELFYDAPAPTPVSIDEPPPPRKPTVTAELPAVVPPGPAVTAFSEPPSTPALDVSPLVTLGDIPDDFMLGEDLPPAIDSAALEVPAPTTPRRPVTEERVRVVEMEEESSAPVVTVDTDSDVVVVDSEDEFVPSSGTSEAPAAAPESPTPSHPFLSAVPAETVPEKPAPAEPVPERPAPGEPGTVAPVPGGPETVAPAPAEVPALEAMELAAIELPAADASDQVPQLPPSELLVSLATQLVGSDPQLAAQARAALVSIGTAALPAILPLFPGRLVFDVRGAHDRVPPLHEHGELLACLIELGPEVCQAVADKLEAPDPLVRFYAVSFLGVVPCARAVGRLAGRLYDRDARVRMAAIEVLACYRRTPGYDAMIKGLRARMKDEDPDQQAIAAALLGNFRDVESLPDLVMLLDARSKVVSRAAAESLAFITKQDLGASERKWLKWWGAHKGESRVLWLIEGLRSKSRDIRFSSAYELQRLTQETFGYYFDADRSDRERSVRQWERWWELKGKQLHLDT